MRGISMTKSIKLISRAGLAAVAMVSAIAAAPAAASAQDWGGRSGYDNYSQGDHGRADYGRDGRYDDARYGHDDGYGDGYRRGGRTINRCSWDRCATFRCDRDGDRCMRI